MAVGSLEAWNVGGRQALVADFRQWLSVGGMLVEQVADASAAHVDKQQSFKYEFHFALAAHQLSHFVDISYSVG